MGTTSIMCRNALDETFEVPSNNRLWSKVGAVSRTPRKCLTNPKVHYGRSDKCDPNFYVFQDIQCPRTTTAPPSSMSRDADAKQFVKVKVSERKAVVPVTIAHTRERQEVAFAAAYMHGNKFVVTGGEHVTSDDMIKGDQ